MWLLRCISSLTRTLVPMPALTHCSYGCHSHTHTHSGSLTPRLPPNLLMSLLARGHCAPWQTQALRQVLLPTPADLHACTHCCVCHSHTPSFA